MCLLHIKLGLTFKHGIGFNNKLFRSDFTKKLAPFQNSNGITVNRSFKLAADTDIFGADVTLGNTGLADYHITDSLNFPLYFTINVKMALKLNITFYCSAVCNDGGGRGYACRNAA